MKKARGLFKIMIAVAFVVEMTFGISTMDAEAASAPTNIEQVYADTDTVMVNWDNNEVGYCWSRFSSSANDLMKETAIDRGYSNHCATFENLEPGRTYYVQIGKSEKPDEADIVWSEPVKVITAPQFEGDFYSEAHVSALQWTSAKETEVSLTWKNATGATGYRVRYEYGKTADESSANCKWVTVNTNEVTLKGLKKNTCYQVYVYPFAKTETGFVADADNVMNAICKTVYVLPDQIQGVYVDRFFMLNKKEATIDFGAMYLDNVDCYKYEIYNADNKKILSGSVDASQGPYFSFYSKKLKENEYYKIRIQAGIKLSNNKVAYGRWSEFKTVARMVEKANVKIKKGKVQKISWKKVKGATKYEIYASTNPERLKKVGETKKTKFDLKRNVKKGKTLYIRIVPIDKKIRGCVRECDYTAAVCRKKKGKFKIYYAI